MKNSISDKRSYLDFRSDWKKIFLSVLFERKSEKTNLDYAKDGCKIKFQTQEEELCMRYCEQIFNIINISPQNTVQKCMKQTYLYLAYL